MRSVSFSTASDFAAPESTFEDFFDDLVSSLPADEEP